MTRGQQVVLLIIVFALLGVTGLLIITLINTQEAASPLPSLTSRSTATVAPTRPPIDTPTAITVPPTWTSQPTRTPPHTNTPRPTHTGTSRPTITPTFLPTFTRRPTFTPVPTPTLVLQNPGFEGIRDNSIPGWNWRAEDNFVPGGAYDPDLSYETPLFKQADDPVRFITGPTLQIDAVQHLKFKVQVFQTLTVSPTVKVGFQVLAGAFSDSGVIKMAAGIDASGRGDCNSAQWSDFLFLDQNGGVQPIVAPEVEASQGGQITVCLFAEPLYAAVSNAAFFDDAELVISTD